MILSCKLKVYPSRLFMLVSDEKVCVLESGVLGAMSRLQNQNVP